MMPVNGDERPRRKKTAYPRLFFNTPENTERSAERLSRWALHKNRTAFELSQISTACKPLRARITLEQIKVSRERLQIERERLQLERERLQFEREKWQKEVEIEERLRAIEESLQDRLR